MSETQQVNSTPRARLKFIDMARSLAILLMLEGHFITQTLANEYRSEEYTAYVIWHFVKGVTAPLFFTVTGVVFVYLLTNYPKAGFFKNKRVTKGFKRALELLFWGYLLQLNFQNLPNYFQGNFGDWASAFHVLQSIGLGIAALLIIFGLFKLLKKVPLALLYFIAGTTLFAFYPSLKSLPEGYYPFPDWPVLFQNMIKGPNSPFPIVPWMAFTMYGGMVGAMLNSYYAHVKKLWFPLGFIALGLSMNFFGFATFSIIDEISISMNWISEPQFAKYAWLYGRLGQVIVLLGVLLFIEKYLKINDNLFLRVGQNTLQIYVVHVIILYGGVFGWGIKTYHSRDLDAWTAIAGAAAFIAAFVVFVKYLDPLTKIYNKCLRVLFFPIIYPWEKLRSS